MSQILNIDFSSVKQLIIDLAAKMNTDYEEDHHEWCVPIPSEFGSGHVKAIQFDFGLGAVEIDFVLKEDIRFHFDRGVVHPLKLIFNRETEIEHGFQHEDDTNTIKRLENIIAASVPDHDHVFKVPGGKPICLFSLDINRKEFESKIESFLPEMNSDLVSLFRDVNGVNQFFYKGNFSLEIAKFIEEFVECELNGFMKHVYLEGKAYEIFTHQLKQYLDDLNEPNKRLILRQSTIERIEEAADIIEDEIEMSLNVVGLAKRVGLNQNTLQNGFKKLFGVSVNEYIRNHRVDTAKKLLETTDLNITQITYKIGINSRSYFTKLFKKRYGTTPKSYMEQSRRGDKESQSA